MIRLCSGVALAGLIITGALLGACATQKAPPATADGIVTPGREPVVGGTALPSGYKINTDRTLVLGGNDNWTGRLSYTTSTGADDVFNFLRREMPNFGWMETAGMRSDVSVLTFTSSSTGRVAMIHIERGSAIGGRSRVEMVVSPNSPAPAADSYSTAPATSSPDMSAPVVSSPMQ